MRGVWTGADVGNEIDRRDDVHPGINNAGVEELVVPSINAAGFYRLEYGIPEIRQLRIIKNFLEQPVFAGQRKRAEPEIVVGPTAAPGRPSPDVSVSAEIVARGRLDVTPGEVAARHQTDPRIVGKAREHGAAEIKKRRHRETIVLGQDRRIDMFEQPVDAARHPTSTTQIAVAEIGRDLTRPTDLHQNFSDFVAGSVVLGTIRPWSIRDEEEPLRPPLGNGVEDPAGQP